MDIKNNILTESFRLAVTHIQGFQLFQCFVSSSLVP